MEMEWPVFGWRIVSNMSVYACVYFFGWCLGDGQRRDEVRGRREDRGGSWGGDVRRRGDALKGLVNY